MAADQNQVTAFEADKYKMDKYSRQVGAYGVGVMAKMIRMKVLVIGLKGVGIEAAKNLILAGVGGVTLYDDDIVKIQDLGTNFYVTEEDVGERSVAEASLAKLKSLNPLVTVDVHKGELNSKHVKKYAVVVDCGLNSAQAVVCDAQCRRASAEAKYIRARVHGLVGYIFNDFGDKFVVNDKTGEEPVTRVINAIESSDKEGELIVRILATKRHNIDFDDHVNFIKFDEVEGELGEILNKAKDSFEVKENTIKKEDGTTAFDPYSLRVVIKGVKLPKGKIEYNGGGQIIQTKRPVEMKFSSLEKSLANPVHPDEGMLAFTDGTKFGRPEQLHIALNGLWKYEVKHKGLPPANNQEAINEIVDLAKAYNEEMKKTKENLSVEELDEEIVANLARFAECNFQPLCCFFGGVVAQEVVKYAGKYTPLRQWLHLDFFEVMPEKFVDEKNPDVIKITDEDREPLGNRYDDMVKILGRPLHQKLMQSSTFMVGCGALGCELFKNFALIGLACDDEKKGLITVTDNDRIEVSNLSRQFLFRENNVGQPKSIAASDAVKVMNPSINVRALETLVAPHTENVFTSEFWQSLDFVTNALDNVKARLYVDGQCVFYGKPLLESGTLGTKCNSQIIVPHMTQSYADGPNDEQGDVIPMCTLRNFPSEIEHCIEWARARFTDLFETEVTKAHNFLENPASFIADVKAKTLDLDTEGKILSGVSSELPSLKTVYHVINTAKSPETTFETCVKEAYIEFHKSFRDRILSLIKAHPEDDLDEDGNKFWDKTKRFPQVATFDAENDLHLGFILSMANILSMNYGLVKETKFLEMDLEKVKEIVSKLEPPEASLQKVDLSEGDESEEKNENEEQQTVSKKDVQELEQILNDLEKLSKSGELKNIVVEAAAFEKDDDSNSHIDFITATSNLRGFNYRLKPVARHKAKLIAGRIIPALATTTAAVTGLVVIELLKLIQPGKTLEAYRESSNSLAVNLYMFMEPSPPVQNLDAYDNITLSEVVCLPPKFTKWDKTIIKGESLTLKEFMDAFSKHFKDKFEVDLKMTLLMHQSGNLKGMPGYGQVIYDETRSIGNDVMDVPLKDIVTKIYGEDVIGATNIALDCSACSADEDEETEYKVATLVYQFA